MKALLITTCGLVTEVDQHGLGDLQVLLTGPIEGLGIDGRHDVAVYVNERGILDGLAENPRATRLLGLPIAGPAVLCGFDPATGEQAPIPSDVVDAMLTTSGTAIGQD